MSVFWWWRVEKWLGAVNEGHISYIVDWHYAHYI